MREFKIFRSHRKQFIPDLRNAELPGIFRGRPVISEDIRPDEASRLSKICPVGAIQTVPFSLDLGRCVFCRECEFFLPDKVSFTNDYRLAANRREDLIIKAGENHPVRLFEPAVNPEIRRVFKHSLKLRQVSAGGDNSCEMELNAAGNVNFDMGRYGIQFVASPRHADGMVLTGPLTQNMSEALKLTWEAIPSPKIFILVGSDAISGGLFSESPAIDRQFLNDHPADLYLPGNPTHPLTFINGIMDLIGI